MNLKLTFSNGTIKTTEFITQNAKLTEVFYNELKSAENSFTLSIPFNEEIADLIKADISNNIKAEVIDNSNYIFSGYLRKTVNFTKTQRNQPINLEIVTPGYLMDSTHKGASMNYTNISLANVISNIVSATPYIGQIDVTNVASEIIQIFVLKEGENYLTVLKDILFEYGYTYSFTSNGVFTVYPLYESQPATITQQFNGDNCLNEITQTVNERKYNQFTVQYTPVTQQSDVLIFEDTTGANTTNPASIPISASSYYLGEQFNYLKYDSKFESIIWINNARLDIEFDSLTGITQQFTNKGVEGELSIYNSSSSQRTINKLQIYGDGFYGESVNLSKIGDSGKELNYKAKYIQVELAARTLAENLNKYYKYANFNLTVISKSKYALGSFVSVSDEGLGTINCKVIKRITDIYTGKYTYTLESVSDYDPVETYNFQQNVKSKHNTTGIPGPQGETGATGLKALQHNKNFIGTYTTINQTVASRITNFNRTPVVGDVFTVLDGSSNSGSWEVTSVSDTTATNKLLSYISTKGAPGTRGNLEFSGTEIYTKRYTTTGVAELITTASTGITANNMTILVGDTYVNTDTSDVWVCTSSGTASTNGTSVGTAKWKWLERRLDDSDRNNALRFWNADRPRTNSASGYTVEKVTGLNPFGELDTLMKVTKSGTNAGCIRPYSNYNFEVESTKTYRYVIYIKQSDNLTTDYLGPFGYETTNSYVTNLNGIPRAAAYSIYSTNFGDLGKWYMVVGYVVGCNETTAPNSDYGVYDCATGLKTSNIVTNFRWKPDIQEGQFTGTLIAYTTSTSSINSERFIWDIRFDLCDGNEPSVNELLHKTNNGKTISYKVNYESFSTANPGGMYVHGYNILGEEADVAGYVTVNGSRYYCKGMLNTNNAFDGYIGIPTSASNITAAERPVAIYTNNGVDWYKITNDSTTHTPSVVNLTPSEWIIFGKALYRSLDTSETETALTFEEITPCLLSSINYPFEYKYEGIISSALTIDGKALITTYKINQSGTTFSISSSGTKYATRGGVYLRVNAVPATNSTVEIIVFNGTTWNAVGANEERYKQLIALCTGDIPALAGYYKTLNLTIPTVCGTYIETLTSNQAFIENLFSNKINIGDYIQSSNWVEGSTGFKFSSNGKANINELKIKQMRLTCDENENLSLGSHVLVNAFLSGDNNIGIGREALYSNTEGSHNIALGNVALALNSTGSDNVSIGHGSLNHNTTGFANIGIGYTALISNTTGENNIGIGYQSLVYNTTGRANVAIGCDAGATITTGSNNTFIGDIAGEYRIKESWDNQINIGNRLNYVEFNKNASQGTVFTVLTNYLRCNLSGTGEAYRCVSCIGTVGSAESTRYKEISFLYYDSETKLTLRNVNETIYLTLNKGTTTAIGNSLCLFFPSIIGDGQFIVSDNNK